MNDKILSVLVNYPKVYQPAYACKRAYLVGKVGSEIALKYEDRGLMTGLAFPKPLPRSLQSFFLCPMVSAARLGFGLLTFGYYLHVRRKDEGVYET